MPLVWASLALSILLSTSGAVVAFRRGRALWRDLKRGVGALALGLDETSSNAERTAARAEILGAVSARTEPSTRRLRASLARLAVLRAAAQDVRDAVGRVTVLYPRK